MYVLAHNILRMFQSLGRFGFSTVWDGGSIHLLGQ